MRININYAKKEKEEPAGAVNDVNASLTHNLRLRLFSKHMTEERMYSLGTEDFGAANLVVDITHGLILFILLHIGFNEVGVVGEPDASGAQQEKDDVERSHSSHRKKRILTELAGNKASKQMESCQGKDRRRYWAGLTRWQPTQSVILGPVAPSPRLGASLFSSLRRVAVGVCKVNAARSRASSRVRE